MGRSWIVLLAAAIVSGACNADDPAPDRAVPATGAPPTVVESTTTTLPATTTAPPGADACPAIPARRAPDPNRPQYDVEMSADPTTGVVEGTQTVAFTPDLPTDRLVFRLWANGPRPARAGTSIALGAVTGSGAVLGVSQPDPTTAVVALGRWLAPGERVEVVVPWRLQVGGPASDRIALEGGSLRLGSFLPLLAWEAGAGWAIEPPTALFAEATTSPTADWTMRIAAPAGFGVVASGVEVVPGTWEAPLARDVAVAVGRFIVARAVANAPQPVDVVVAVHDGIDDTAAYLAQLVEQLEAMAARYGPYPWPTYQLSITPSLGGGIEYPMHVLQGPGTDGRTTPHEVAHMWFYGLVGNNQARDPWLDEGLATWAEARHLGTLDELAATTIPADGMGQAAAPMTAWEGRSGSYYRSVYTQPAAALAGLGAPELVDCALARYVARTAHAIARPEDLVEALDATFRSWRPVLAPAGLP